jgi:hypothetical protein
VPVKTISSEIKDIQKVISPSVAAGALTVPATAPTDTAGFEFTSTGREIVILQNSGASAYTFTLVSSADPYGRTGDVLNYSLAAGEFAIFAPQYAGYASGAGKITITVSNIAIKILIGRAPGAL